MSAVIPAASTPVRVPVRPGIGWTLYAGYLTIFYATWAVNQVDYNRIGIDAASARLHYALPTLFGSAFLVVALTWLGWWRVVLCDRTRQGPVWAWLGPLAMAGLAVGSMMTLRPENASAALVLWSVLGGIGVGFGEEMITRGALLVGLRSRHGEGRAWLIGTLAFSALHAPNVLFGLSLPGMLVQLLLTFIVGSLLYATRRLSGTLLLPMLLHGFWDSATFLPRATGADGYLPAFLIYPVAIVCAAAVIRRGWRQRLG